MLQGNTQAYGDEHPVWATKLSIADCFLTIKAYVPGTHMTKGGTQQRPRCQIEPDYGMRGENVSLHGIYVSSA